jgi:hypothetical protein
VRDRFLNVKNKVVGEVNTELGEVKIRALSLGEVNEIGKTGQDPIRLFVLCVLYGVCDDDGCRIFKDEDYDVLLAKPFDLLKPIADEVSKHLRLDQPAIDQAKKN